MIYKFTSKASGDVIMLGAHGDELLRLLGREPAARGIFEVAHMAGVLQTLETVVAAEAAQSPADPAQPKAPRADNDAAEPTVALRQRLWPLMDMLRRSLAAGQPVVWGV